MEFPLTAIVIGCEAHFLCLGICGEADDHVVVVASVSGRWETRLSWQAGHRAGGGLRTAPNKDLHNVGVFLRVKGCKLRKRSL